MTQGFLVDFDRMDQLCELAKVGHSTAAAEVREAMTLLADAPTQWQWCLHGELRRYRRAVVEEMCRLGQWRCAWRFVKCGLADRVEERDGKFRIKARRCMHRLCPRCSKTNGAAMVRKVQKILSRREVGTLWHMTLTQEVRPAESLAETRARFEAKWGRFAHVRKSEGVAGGLLTIHAKWSANGGWHWHGHLVMETSGIDEARMQVFAERWSRILAESGEVERTAWFRKVIDASPALTFDGDEGDLDLFGEATGQAAKVVQYMLRDVGQGFETWVVDCTDEEEILDFLRTMREAKLHRLFGEWRKGAVADEADEEIAEEAVAKMKEDGEWTTVGSVDRCIQNAAKGVARELEVLKWLLSRFSGRSSVRARLGVLFVTMTAGADG